MSIIVSPCFELKDHLAGYLISQRRAGPTQRYHNTVTKITRQFHIRQNLGNYDKMCIESRGTQMPLLNCRNYAYRIIYLPYNEHIKVNLFPTYCTTTCICKLYYISCLTCRKPQFGNIPQIQRFYDKHYRLTILYPVKPE